MSLDASQPWCVIGAGPCGLTALKNFRQRGIPCLAFEREDDVGGNWYYGKPASSVYASTHLISSKRFIEYTDFPMPAEYPAYPSHVQVLEYLRSYARNFQLYDHIRFNTSVERAEPAAEGGWNVTLRGAEQPRRFAGLVIANGHHWDPQTPAFPGQFSGQTIHAHDYKTSDVLQDKRVLVVGAGNSGCDIAVEAAQHAASAVLSMRRGYHFLPKFLLGKPVDQCGHRLLEWYAPLWLRRLIARFAIRIATGPPHRYGLPRPDHALFETHPIVNSQLLYYAGHGRVRIKPNIERLNGATVKFTDGSEEPFDLIVYATGYKLSFPFLDSKLLNWQEGRPRLFLNAFHPERDDLFVCGMIQPDSGIWGLADLQAQVMSAFIVACERNMPLADVFRRTKADRPERIVSGGIHYVDSPRHHLEVQYYRYGNLLRSLLFGFGDKKQARLSLVADGAKAV